MFTVEQKCKAVADVAFILDSSGSLRAEYFKEKDFLKELMASFGISKDGSRGAVVTFSFYAEHSIKFRDYEDMKSFSEAVDNIPLMGSTTRIDKALRLTQKEVFTLNSGARPGVPKVLILLTDGSQTLDEDAEEPSEISTELRNAGIPIIVIGIGSGVNRTELTNIAGSKENVYAAQDFDILKQGGFIQNITSLTCATGNEFIVSM